MNIIEKADDFYKTKNCSIIGAGSNLLIKNTKAEFCKLSDVFSFVKIDGDTLICGGALTISKLMRFLINHAVSSLEFLSGIPATIGGAVAMNAGAFGYSICDKLLYVKAFCKGRGIIKFKRCDMNFGYRTSSVDDCIVLEAGFKYDKKERKLIINSITNNIQKRISSAHLKNTFGSVFKNPKGYYAGKLLEISGLKGFKRNTAHISNKHANYILGSSRTDVNDILFLMDYAESRVSKNCGIELETEVVVL